MNCITNCKMFFYYSIYHLTSLLNYLIYVDCLLSPQPKSTPISNDLLINFSLICFSIISGVNIISALNISRKSATTLLIFISLGGIK